MSFVSASIAVHVQTSPAPCFLRLQCGRKYIFELFGITLPAFLITGGILVFQIGLHMLQGQQSKVHQPGENAAEKSRAAQLSVAVSPLAVPILAGPGTIATAMSFVADCRTRLRRGGSFHQIYDSAKLKLSDPGTQR